MPARGAPEARDRWCGGAGRLSRWGLNFLYSDMTPVKNKIFGPVLCVQRFGDNDIDEVVRDANSTIYGLSGSVWARDVRVALQLARKIDSGEVSVNMHAAIDPAVPFGPRSPPVCRRP